ncbi:MAG: ABC transporter substrate-binding protein [Actinomycetota bacterium]|nr:ABC transporter substrate-binding protein [Actinomycetota bacterium]
MYGTRGAVSGGRSFSRREFLRVGGASLARTALFGGTLAGCGGGGSDSGDLIFSMGPDTTGNLQKLVKKFNDQNKGDFQAKYRVMPADSGQYFEQLRTQFQAGGGGVDVIGGDVIWPAQFAANGWIADVSDRFPESERSNFLDGPIQSLIYEDKIYGVPWFTDAGMLYYRSDLLDKSGFSGPPKTWEELKEQAMKVVRDQGVKYGFLFQGAEYEGGTVNGLEYIWTHGGDALDGQAVVIDSPESVAGLRTQQDMVIDGVAPQAVANYTETESQSTFLNGDAVFCRNWPYMYALVGNPDESTIEPGQVGVAPLPVGGSQTQTVSGLGGWNMMINASSDKPDEAWEFIQFMTNESSQKFRALEATLLPTLNSLYEDREVVENVPVIRLGAEALKSSRPRPVSPYYSDMSLSMAAQFNDLVSDNTSPEKAARTLQEELKNIVEQS